MAANTVTGNKIGTNDDGESAIANTGVGIAVQGNNNTMIGGDGASQNTVAFNGADGVQVVDPDVDILAANSARTGSTTTAGSGSISTQMA